MDTRVERLIFFLYSQKGQYLTASDLAKKIECSRKTVITTMLEVKNYVELNGAKIIVKKGRGYLLVIEDKQVFDNSFRLSFFQSMITKNTDVFRNRVIQIARKIVSQTNPIQIDDLIAEMYLSRSAIRRELKEAYSILSQYSIHINTNNKAGLIFNGEEKNIRFCLVDLLGMFYNVNMVEINDLDYAKWIACEIDEANTIRKTVLKALKHSHIKMRDILTQRLAVYLIVTRNRIRHGYTITTLSRQEIKLVSNLKRKSLTDTLFDFLQKEVGNFDFSKEERMMVEEIFGTFCEDVKIENKRLNNKCNTIANTIENEYGSHVCPTSYQSLFASVLRSTIIRCLLRKEFNLDGIARVLYNEVDTSINLSPLSKFYGKMIVDKIAEMSNTQAYYHDFQNISRLVYYALSYYEFEYKKLNLLTCLTNGTDNSRMIIEKWNQLFAKYIQSNKAVMLYEVRDLNQSEYDGILITSTKYAYKEKIRPYYVTTVVNSSAYINFFDEFILPCYEIEKYLPSKNQIIVIKDYSYRNEKEFLKYILKEFTSSSLSMKEKKQMLLMNLDQRFLFINNGALILFASQNMFEDKVIVIHEFSNSIKWDKKEIHVIYLFCMDTSVKMNKIIEIISTQIMQLENASIKIEDYHMFFMNMIYSEIKKENFILSM